MLWTRHFGPQTNPQANEIVGDFVSRMIWQRGGAIRDYCSMGVMDPSGYLVAGTLYHNWHPDSGVIELTSASATRRWLTRPVIRSMFWLPFERLGCQLCALRVSDRNERMIGIARRFGFSEFHIPRMRGRDEGEFVFTLTDDAWRASRYYKDNS